MLRRYLTATLLLAVALAFVSTSLQAQDLRMGKTVYLTPRVGVVGYRGDESFNSLDAGNVYEDAETIFDFGDDFPLGLGLDLGYQFSPAFGLQLGWNTGWYPDVINSTAGAVAADCPDGGDCGPGSPDEDVRHTLQLVGRYTIGAKNWRLAPFIELGGAYHIKQVDGAEGTPLGAVAGLGLDFAISPRVSLIVDAHTNMIFADEAVDGNKSGDGQKFDNLNWLGLGLKINLAKGFVPVAISGVDCPTTLEAGQTGTFTATTNDNATLPVEYRWDFGDNSNGTGLVASHSFATAGTYTVRFQAANDGTTVEQTCSVNVTPQPVPAEITNVSANPMSFEVCEPVTVNFTAATRGDAPVTYNWNFGDGSTGTGATASHTYSREGTYTVTLNVSNARGSDSQTITIRANACDNACQDISELNSVYFDRNASTLTDEGRAALQENIDILKECPTICVRLEGWAAPGERNAQSLSEDRARAVEQFYIDNGITGSRLMAVGMGQVQGMTSKKEGADRARRVDSIPMACDAMGSK